MADVSIKVLLFEKPAMESLRRLTKAFKDNATAWNQSLELIKKAWGALTGLINVGVQAITGWTKAAMEAEKAERQAIAAINLHRSANNQIIDSLKEFNNQLQQKGVADADDLLALQAKLAALGVLPSKLEQATKATLGLSEATGKGLTQSARKVAQAFGKGDEGLAGLFDIVKAKADSLEGQLLTLNSNWGDLHETLGNAFTQSQTVKAGLDALNEILRRFNAHFASAEGRKQIEEYFQILIAFASVTTKALANLAETITSPIDRIRRLIADIRGDAVLVTESGVSLIDQARSAAGALDKALVTSMVNQGTLRGGEAGTPKKLDKFVNTPKRKKGEGGSVFIGADDTLGMSSLFRGLAQDQQNLQLQQQLQNQYLDSLREFNLQEAELRRQHNVAMVDANNEWTKTEMVRQQRHGEFFNQMTMTTLGGFADIAGAALVGGVDVGKAFGGLFADLLGMTADYLITQGGASEIGATLATLFGVPGVGAATILGGLALKVAASALRAGLSGSSGRSYGGAGRIPSRGSGQGRGATRGGQNPFIAPTDASGNSTNGGFTSSKPGETRNVYNISFGRAFVAGSEASVGREVIKMIQAADRLRGGVTR